MMKKSAHFFLLITFVAVSLLITITITQLVTQKSLSRLQQGNQQATATFTMNNRLQEMVNLAFELETKMVNGKPVDLISPNGGIKDSLTRLQYNTGILKKVWTDTVQLTSLDKLVKFVDNQVELSFTILAAIEGNQLKKQKEMTDSLAKSHWGDSIYSSAISFQKGLERNLGYTLAKNNKASSELSVLTRFLAIVSLLAILILATIIIRRQVKQLSLIKEIEEARKEALLSVEAKDQFLANMSHELRTPLNAIKGFGKILLNTPLNVEQQKYTSIISTASDNLLNIVNDILDFSKIETGNMVMKKKVFHLRQIINEIELLFAPLALEKELKLFFSCENSIPGSVKGDPERLKQILVNLVSNAIKFTNRGTVSLDIKGVESGNKLKTKFIIADTGVGIPYEKVGIIFERFEQLEQTFTRQQGGTGLGLAITKKLVEAMGGKISVKSEVNRGSVFTVDLEFEKINIDETVEKKLQPETDLKNVSLKNKRVLVAEDNKMNQLLIKSMLDNYQAIIEIVENGEEVVQAAKNNTYDLILMDVQMPKIDGITATKLIRKDIDKVIPVIAMTAYVLPGEREKCIEAGMNDYLSKPLDEIEVISMLKKYVSVGGEKEFKKNSYDQADWLNMNYLNSICGNDEHRIMRILTELQKQLSLEVITLQKSLNGITTSEIKQICHHLKSTLSPLSVSAKPVIILEKLSGFVNHEKFEIQVKEQVNQLIEELEKIIIELDDILKENFANR
jgi:signal transduction histidine kinase/CheY-like chemotaxis protein